MAGGIFPLPLPEGEMSERSEDRGGGSSPPA